MSRFNYLGPAQHLRLDVACAPIRDAFDNAPMLVGSVLERPDFRDVDVRLMVDDDEYERMFGDVANDPRAAMRALLINSALSDWLAHTTGLPVDFQFQPVSQTRQYDSRPRSALALHDAAIRYASTSEGSE